MSLLRVWYGVPGSAQLPCSSKILISFLEIKGLFKKREKQAQAEAERREREALEEAELAREEAELAEAEAALEKRSKRPAVKAAKP